MLKFLWNKVQSVYQKHEILRNFTAVFSVDILVKASGFLLLPVYLKLMSQAEFGLFSYLLNIINTLALSLNFGLYVAQSKLYFDYTDIKARGSLLFTLNFSLFVLILLVLTTLYFTNGDFYIIRLLIITPINYGKYRIIIILGLITYIYSLLLYNFLMTSAQIRLVQILNITKLFLLNGVVLCVLYFSKNDKAYERLLFSIVFEMLLTLSFYYFYIKKMTFKFDFSIALRSLKIGMPIMGSAIVGIVISLSDKYFVEKSGGLTDLSLYYLALTIAGIIATIFSTIQNVWLPNFFKEKDWHENLRKTKKVIVTIIGLFVVISLGIYAAVFLALHFEIIEKKYFLILYLLPILFLSQIVACTAVLVSNYILYLEKTYFGLIFTVVISFSSLFINYILITKFGIYGAAFANLCISLLSFSLYYVYLKINMASK